MVQVDKHYGEVKEIATRYTVLRSLDGSESIMPNETMITSPVINRSLTDKDNQILLPVQVAYGSATWNGCAVCCWKSRGQ
jgi:small-conductance mechanosensitive channel